MVQAGAVEPITSDAIATEAQREADKIRRFLLQSRVILNADQLASMISPRAHFEIDFPNLHCYFFTVDGMLHGKKIIGALFAGEPMLVRAANYAQAQELANQGLRHTIELLHKEYSSRPFRLSPVAEGLAQDAAGRRGREGDKLAKLPKMRAFLEHIIGAKPWRF